MSGLNAQGCSLDASGGCCLGAQGSSFRRPPTAHPPPTHRPPPPTHRPPPRRRSTCSTASRSAWRSAASATRSSRRCATTWSSSSAPSRAAPRSRCTSRCPSRRPAAARARAYKRIRTHAPAPPPTARTPAPAPEPQHFTAAPISAAQIAYVSQYLGVDSVVQPHLMWVASAALCDMLAPALPAGWEKALLLTMPALTTALPLTMAPPGIARGARFATTVLTVEGQAPALAASPSS